MTLKQLSKETGYDSRDLSAWENGIKEPPISVAVQWALAFEHRVCISDWRERNAKRRQECPCLEDHGEVDNTATIAETPAHGKS